MQEPKHDDTLNGKWPVRPPPPDGDDDPVLPRRARGKGKHARGKGGELAKGGQKGRVREPNKDKMVLDLRKVRSEANKLDEGPWSLSAAMDRAVQSTARKATDDIRALVGLGKIHVKHAEHGKSAKTGAEVAPPAMETGANAQHSQLEDLNALTADVDEVFRNDDLSDMSGVDAKLHQLVNNMRQRRAGRGTH
jgi:predicted flap endonuclease-1-like 5' DNA nuclease